MSHILLLYSNVPKIIYQKKEQLYTQINKNAKCINNCWCIPQLANVITSRLLFVVAGLERLPLPAVQC
jgi:hypothetical protein